MKYETNYNTAANWLHNNYILLNNICEIDPSVFDNCEDTGKEIAQFFITDASREDVDFLREHFGLIFSYSDLLDKYILCVDHYGTAWDYVYCETDLECAARELGE